MMHILTLTRAISFHVSLFPRKVELQALKLQVESESLPLKATTHMYHKLAKELETKGVKCLGHDHFALALLTKKIFG